MDCRRKYRLVETFEFWSDLDSWYWRLPSVFKFFSKPKIKQTLYKVIKIPKTTKIVKKERNNEEKERNLAFFVDKDIVFHFFEDVSEVVDVRLAMNDDGSLQGFGHVKFSSEEVAMKSMEQNG
eukprot:Gb_16745 [translate_table: standard]